MMEAQMSGDLLCKPREAAIVPSPVWDGQEADHRVANSLQLVAALLGLQAKQSVAIVVWDALAAAINRIAAVGLVHRQLSQPGSHAAIDIGSYLVDLTTLLEQHRGTGLHRILAHAQSRLVTAEFAKMIGVVVAELVMNACKHAYGPGESGSVDICLFFPKPSEFQLEVRDYGGPSTMDGSGPQAGVGTRIVNAMSRKLDTTYAYVPDDEGTRFYMHGIVYPDVA
jgi:two-component sensor histidine kinase